MEISKYIKDNKLNIILKPNSNEDKILDFKDNNLIIKIKAKPQENKANLALIKLIKRTTKKNVRIIRGLKSKRKILEVI